MDYSGIRRGPKMGTLHLSATKDFAPSATSSAIPVPGPTFNFEDGLRSPQSSLGLLRAEDLNSYTTKLEAKSFLNFLYEDRVNPENSVGASKSLPSMYLNETQETSVELPKGLPSMYLKPTENADGTLENMDWKALFNSDSFRQFQRSEAGQSLESMDWKTFLNSDSFRQFQRALPDISKENDPNGKHLVSARSSFIRGELPKELNTADERFADSTTNASSSIYSYNSSNVAAKENLNAGKRNPFDNDERTGGIVPEVDLGQFNAVADPLAFINEEEKRFEQENQFVAPDNVLDKPSRALSLPAPVTREPINPNTFPITSDRNSVIWCGVARGKSEDKAVTLKNEWKCEVTLSMMIGGSSNFKLTESGADRTVLTIPSQAQRLFYVSFVPSEADFNMWEAAELVIKPKDLIGGKALKGTITLYGKCGKSEVHFPDLCRAPKRYGNSAETFTISLGELPEDICKVSRFNVENKGSSPAFVNLEPFLDEDLTSDISGDAIRLEPNYFILAPMSFKEITLRIDPALIEGDSDTSSLLGSIFCLVGDESTLGLLSQYITKSGNSPCLAGTPLNKMVENFRKSNNFPANQDQMLVLISGTDINWRDLQDEMTVKCINIYGRKLPPREFQFLVVEETLSPF